jgi:hypothetical protein
MERQEVFDTVARHLHKQGVASVDLDETCLYRGPDGLRCAIGVLIPDSVYRSDMEYEKIRVIADYDGMPAFIADPGNEDFLVYLQYVHDEFMPISPVLGEEEYRNEEEYRSMDNVDKELRKVAAKYKLSSTVLDGLA